MTSLSQFLKQNDAHMLCKFKTHMYVRLFCLCDCWLLKLSWNIQLEFSEIFPISSLENLQELPDIAPVHTHRGHFGAAVFMEFVATCLATETIQKKLLANITER